MPRPKKCRRICHKPLINGFKPIGIPIIQLDSVQLNNDELEAIRLADLQNKKQEEAAIEMQISRQTFGRIIASAHFKIADALINNKVLLLKETENDIMSYEKEEDNYHKWEHFSRIKKGGSKHGKVW